MGRQAIQQPNGKYAIWSTVVDDFLFQDMTLDEVKNHIMADKYSSVRKYEHYKSIAETAEDKDNYQYIIDMEISTLNEIFNMYMQRVQKDNEPFAYYIGRVAVLHGTDEAKQRLEAVGESYEKYEATINEFLAESEMDA